MERYIHIKTFAKRVGLAPSTLRYYEQEALLLPAHREPNGYRAYSESQIEVAKLIQSLRISNVPISEIKLFLHADLSLQEEMRKKWLHSLHSQIHTLQAGIHYLEHLQEDTADIFLIEKQAETVIWFPAEAAIGKFSAAFEARQRELNALRIRTATMYLQYISGKEWINARIGYKVESPFEEGKLPQGAKMEHRPPCLCLALRYTASFSPIQQAYRRLTHYIANSNWIPAGAMQECYREETKNDEVELLMPVIPLSNER